MKHIQIHGSQVRLSLGLLVLALFIVQPVPASADCPTPSSSLGSATLSVSVANAGAYHIWSRIKAPNTTANSYTLQIDKTCTLTVGDAVIPANTWTWVDYQSGTSTNKITVTLSAGTHSFLLVGREAGVQIDRLLAVQDSCVPTGLGDNCSASSVGGNPAPNPMIPPPGSVPNTGTPPAGTNGTITNDPNAPASTPITQTLVIQPNDVKPGDGAGNQGAPVTPTVSGTIAVVPAMPSSVDSDVYITRVEYYVDGKYVASVSSTPFKYVINTKKLTNGSHEISTKTYYSSGAAETSVQHIIVKNEMSITSALTSAKVRASAGALVILALPVGFWLFTHRRRGLPAASPSDSDTDMHTTILSNKSSAAEQPFASGHYEPEVIKHADTKESTTDEN